MDTDTDTLYKQGAEGRIYKIDYLGRTALLKERFPKKYRNEDLDNHLTKERIRAEAKNILRCKNAGIYVPAVYLVDFDKRRIILEYIENSETVSDYISQLTKDRNAGKEELANLSAKIGAVIGKMHLNNIIHGDLTTSNILVKRNDIEGSSDLYLIDFGLSYTKSADEDKAVDLYVLERALTSKHNDVNWFFDNILVSYAKFHKSNEKVVRKLSEVRSRGRKRTMVG